MALEHFYCLPSVLVECGANANFARLVQCLLILFDIIVQFWVCRAVAMH